MNDAIKEKYKFRFSDDGYFESCLIPLELGVCPNCESQLVAESQEWEVESKLPTGIQVDCIREMECFLEYEHSEPNRMPYVYWLPLETKAEAWILEQLQTN